MTLVDDVYEAATNAGFLKLCEWQPSNGELPRSGMVGLRAPDESVLDHLTQSTETSISYPAAVFAGLTTGERVSIEGVLYQVREVRALHDGSEKRAKLTRL